MREISDVTEFKTLVQTATEPVVVWFGASWCGPCRALDATALSTAASRLGLTLVHCDVDHGEAIASLCGIRKIPTFKVFRNNRVAGTFQSANTQEVIVFLERFASPPPA